MTSSSPEPRAPVWKSFRFIVGLLMVLVAAGLIYRALNVRAGFPEDDRRAFMATCHEGGASQDFCECLLERLEARVTIEELRGLDAEFRRTKQMPAVFAQDVSTCIAETGG